MYAPHGPQLLRRSLSGPKEGRVLCAEASQVLREEESTLRRSLSVPKEEESTLCAEASNPPREVYLPIYASLASICLPTGLRRVWRKGAKSGNNLGNNRE